MMHLRRLAISALPEQRLRAHEVHDQIKATMQLIRAGFFDLIELLTEFKNGQYYYVLGFNSMRDYIQAISGYKDRMTFYIQKIIENGALSEYIIQNREEAEQIGQSKIIALAESQQVNRDNVYEMTTTAIRARTVRDLQETLAGHGIGDHPANMQLLFLTRDDWDFVRDAIERVRQQTGTENNGRIVRMAFEELYSSHPQWWEQ